MAGKATRLRFTEDELENPKLRRAAEKADRAADRADRAAEKIRKKHRPKLNTDQRSQRKKTRLPLPAKLPAGAIASEGLLSSYREPCMERLPRRIRMTMLPWRRQTPEPVWRKVECMPWNMHLTAKS